MVTLTPVFCPNNLLLHHNINESNEKIKELNSTYGVQAPRFSTDMIKPENLKKELSHQNCVI